LLDIHFHFLDVAMYNEDGTMSKALMAEEKLEHIGQRANKVNQSSTFFEALPFMNQKTLLEAAIEQGGYETPELNDKLYLHFKGYRRIENLEGTCSHEAHQRTNGRYVELLGRSDNDKIKLTPLSSPPPTQNTPASLPSGLTPMASPKLRASQP
jgi:hypothetical protein